MRRKRRAGKRRRVRSMGVDANGRPTEIVEINGTEVIVHYADLPESDVTEIEGLRVTTPLRTMIDIAPDVTAAEFQRMVRHCLDRGMFTIEEGYARIAEPDMLTYPGARLLEQQLRVEERRARSNDN